MADYSITGDTRLDASGFNKGLSAMSVAAGNLISGLTQAATGKLTALAKTSVGVGMSFQSSMSQVAATMGVGVDQIQSLTDKAKEMGSTTAFTATQAADALNYLALAGYDANKAAEVLPSVLNLAAAGGMDLAYASDLVTDAMASLNLEANKQNVDEFGNKLAKAASKANANVSQLGEAILTVGGTAANLKGGTTELTTALGLLANVGIKGAEGGTHLRNIILSLQSPTDDATKLMEQLGLQVYDAQGNMRGLDDILTDLSGSLAGLTQGQKDSVINALFNKTDLAAVNGLLTAQGEQWESLAQQIDAAGEAAGDSGAMAQMAETQLDNLQGSVTIMQSALEGLQLGIYDYLEPSLNEAAKWGSECFSTLTKALSEGGPEAMLQAAGQIISDLAASVTAQLPGLVTSGTEIIVQLAEDIVVATPQLLSSGAEIIGALVQALGVALPQLVSTGIQMISQLSAGLASGIPEFLAKALPLVADFASGLRENIGQIIDAGIELILSLMQGLMDGLPTLIEYLPGIVSDIASIINDNTPKILEAGIQLILMLGKGLLQAVPTLVANIPQICKAIFDVFIAFRWLDIGSQIVEGLWKGLTGGWATLVKKVGGLAQQLPDIVKRVLGIHSPSKVFDEIGVNTCKGLAQGLSKGTARVKHAAKTVVASVTDTATQIVDGVTTVTETVTETMANGSTQQKQIITETSQQIIDGVAKTVKTVTERAADGSESVKRSIEAVRDVVSTVTATQTALVDGAKVTTQTTTETLADGSEQVKRVITSTGTEVIEGFVILINGLIGLYNSVAWLYGGTIDYISNPAWDYANKIAADRKARQEARKKQQEAINNPSSSGTSTNSQKVIESMTDTNKTTRADGSTVTTKVLTEKLQDETGKITQRVTKTVTEAGTKLVDGVERSYKTVTTYVDGVQTKLERSLDDIAKTTTGTKPGSTTPTAPTPDKDLTDAVEANTEALLAANSKLAEMVRQANSLVLSDNMAISRSVAASGTAQVAAAANNYHREGDTNIIQNIYSKAQTAADLQREARWEADRAKAQKR